MASAESIAVADMLRAQLAAAEGPPPSFAEQRAQGAQMLAQMSPLVDGAEVETVTVAGREARWITVPWSDPGRVVLYLHGGGYVIGSVASHQGLASRIAAAGKARALVLDYRLAPEDPFPAAIDDAIAAYEYLVQSGTAPERITIAGDSAGGGLAIATLVAIRDRGLPMPGAAVALSPWADLTNSGESFTSKAAADPMLNLATLEEWAGLYAGDTPVTDPLVSPLHADLSGLPPVLIQVGTAEVLLSDAERLAERIRAAGGSVDYQPEEDLFHVFQLLPLYPEAHAAVDRIGAFVLEKTP